MTENGPAEPTTVQGTLVPAPATAALEGGAGLVRRAGSGASEPLPKRARLLGGGDNGPPASSVLEPIFVAGNPALDPASAGPDAGARAEPVSGAAPSSVTANGPGVTSTDHAFSVAAADSAAAAADAGCKGEAATSLDPAVVGMKVETVDLLSDFPRKPAAVLVRAGHADEPTQAAEMDLSTARAYQLQLFERAKEENLIAVLSTGAGKTLIALMLIRYMASLERDDDENIQRRISIFLVPTVPLVSQQAQYFRFNSDLRVAHLWGGMTTQDHGSVYWKRIVDKHDVAVLTPEILRRALDRGYISLDRFNVLVFDECHHARSNHPYSLIVRTHYADMPVEKRPRILGITASPIASKESFEMAIGELEKNLCARAMTSTLTNEVVQFVSRPRERVEYYEEGDFFDAPSLYLALCETCPAVIRKIGNKFDDAMRACDELGPWCCERMLEMCMATMLRKIRNQVGISSYVDRFAKLSGGAAGESETACAKETPLSTKADAADSPADVKDATSNASEIDEEMPPVKGDSDPVLDAQSAAEALTSLSIEPIISSTLEDVSQRLAALPPADAAIYQFCQSLVESNRMGPEHNPLEPHALSAKMQRLVQILLEFQDNPKFCGIVFVHRRGYAAAVCQALSYHPSLKFLRPRLLIGHGGSSRSAPGESTSMTDRMTIPQQQRTVAEFREGKCNLLVATQVAEEGLDIKPCNIVIRFDMTQTLINYIQSRGRARHTQSQFIVLANRHNRIDEARLYALQREEKSMGERLQKSMQDERKMFERIETQGVDENEKYTIAATGAMVTVSNAIALLNEFCSCLPTDGISLTMPEYTLIELEGANCYYEVRLSLHVRPECRRVCGRNAWSRKLAKQIAAFETVKRLHMFGEIDDWLQPTGMKVREGNTVKDAVIDTVIGPGKISVRAMPLGIPAAFAGEWRDGADAWFTIVLVHDKPFESAVMRGDFSADDLDDELEIGDGFYQAAHGSDATGASDRVARRQAAIDALSLEANLQLIGYLTVGEIPPATDMMRLPINGVPSLVRAHTLQHRLKITSENLALFRRWHYYLNAGLLRTPLSEDSQWAVLAAPVARDIGGVGGFGRLPADAASAIDWNALRYCRDVDPNDLSLVLDPSVGIDEKRDIVLLDRYQYSRKYMINEVRFKMQPTTNQGENLPFPTLVQFYSVRLGCSEPIDESQCAIRATPVPPIAQTTSKASLHKESHVLPQFCTVFPVKRPHLVDGLLSPLILRQIWHRNLAADVKHGRGLALKADVVQEAAAATPTSAYFSASLRLIQKATAAAAADMSFDYERLEILGDSFLKIHQSLHLFVKNPLRHEGWLTLARSNIERNWSLHKRAIELGLNRFIITSPLSRRSWAPPAHDVPQMQNMSEKMLADVVEALVGACVLDGGVTQAAQALRLLLSADYETDWASYYSEWRAAKRKIQQEQMQTFVAEGRVYTDSQTLHITPRAAEAIEETLGYKFQDRELLVEALTHMSAVTAAGNCYQRLEFLGDAVLSFLTTFHLFKTCPNLDQGMLTSLRSELVCNQFLACVSVQNRLTSYLMHADEQVANAIALFAEWYEGKTAASTQRDELLAAGLFWNNAVTAPKIAGDLFEAMLGAVFLDSGCRVDVAWGIVDRLIIQPWWPWFAPLANNIAQNGQLHPVSELYILSKTVLKCGEVHCTFESHGAGKLCTVKVHDRAIGKGIGSAQRDAKRAACKSAVDFIRANSAMLLLACDCSQVKVALEATERHADADLAQDAAEEDVFGEAQPAASADGVSAATEGVQKALAGGGNGGGGDGGGAGLEQLQ
ncbi:Dicer-like protein 1 [Polyrhizophydium stewartii]|uniref:Dicer-like protein 1 n=1 Tax=Polyrhizophydium stewartii TaxID=2732419 RepID=A0ABR4NEW9_9FUNG